MRRKILFGLTLLLINLLLIETASFIAGNWFIPNRFIFNPRFDPETQARNAEIYRLYLQLRNPRTGWPLRKQGPIDTENNPYLRFDAAGRRPSPAFPGVNTNACVSLFGDSFTFSSEVSDEFAWGNRLADKLGCPVHNYGVGGFGSDQAFIRFMNKQDRTPVVFLNHLSENIIRNVTQFRALVIGYDNLRGFVMPLKPRFYFDKNGRLELADMPVIENENYIDFLYRPEKYLQHEYFLPGGDSGINRLRFPYTWTILKLINHFHISAILQDIPWYMPFYEIDHKSKGLEVTGELLLNYRQLANKRGQIPVITIIPTGKDLRYYMKHSAWPYQNLIYYLESRDADVLNFGSGIIDRLENRDPCSLFQDCDSHFNETGYSYLADIAYEHIQAEGLLTHEEAR